MQPAAAPYKNEKTKMYGISCYVGIRDVVTRVAKLIRETIHYCFIGFVVHSEINIPTPLHLFLLTSCFLWEKPGDSSGESLVHLCKSLFLLENTCTRGKFRYLP
ncbi:hypothetical protein [Phaeobacter phage MD18]|nr:hypothetical protein [Phaeobacter phage MD18]